MKDKVLLIASIGLFFIVILLMLVIRNQGLNCIADPVGFGLKAVAKQSGTNVTCSCFFDGNEYQSFAFSTNTERKFPWEVYNPEIFQNMNLGE